GGGRLVQPLDARAPRRRAPGWIRGSRRRDRALDVIARPLLKAAEDDARVDRASVVEFGGGRHRLTADRHRIAAAEGRLHLLDSAVQFAVEILHPLGAHRRVGNLRLGGSGVGWHLVLAAREPLFRGFVDFVFYERSLSSSSGCAARVAASFRSTSPCFTSSVSDSST